MEFQGSSSKGYCTRLYTRSFDPVSHERGPTTAHRQKDFNFGNAPSPVPHSPDVVSLSLLRMVGIEDAHGISYSGCRCCGPQ